MRTSWIAVAAAVAGCLTGLGLTYLEVTSVEIITAGSMNAFNDFGEQEAVSIRPFDDVFAEDNKLTINMPPRSIIQISMQ